MAPSGSTLSGNMRPMTISSGVRWPTSMRFMPGPGTVRRSLFVASIIRLQLIAGVVIRDKIHRHLDLIFAERAFGGIAGAEHRTRQNLVEGNAQRTERAAEILRLTDSLRSQIPLSAPVAQTPGVNLALVRRCMAEVDHLVAVLHGGNKHFRRGLCQRTASANEGAANRDQKQTTRDVRRRSHVRSMISDPVSFTSGVTRHRDEVAGREVRNCHCATPRSTTLSTSSASRYRRVTRSSAAARSFAM